MIARGGFVADLHSGIYGSSESLARAGGDLRVWVDAVYQGLLGRAATGPERDVWANQVAFNGLAGVARAISGSEESMVRRLSAFYQQFLERAPDQGGLGHFMAFMSTRGDFTVPVQMAVSDEFWTNAQR